jgi:hypothetical protein
MRESRGSTGAADLEKLAEWETRAFPRLRSAAERGTPVDDLLPVDPIADKAATRRALEQLRDL